VFAAFLLGFVRVVCADNSVVPAADPEMVEETLESFYRFDETEFVQTENDWMHTNTFRV